MKKFSIIALSLMLAMAFASCSKEQMKSEATSKGMDKAVEMSKPDPKVAACKSDCDKTADACVKKAGKDKKKADACATAKTTCYTNCEKKK